VRLIGRPHHREADGEVSRALAMIHAADPLHPRTQPGRLSPPAQATPDVADVEQDQTLQLPQPSEVDPVRRSRRRLQTTEAGSWGLDRLNQVTQHDGSALSLRSIELQPAALP
jgi:hypothetical protein